MVGHLVETSRIADLRSGFFGAVVMKTVESKSYLLIGGVLSARPKSHYRHRQIIRISAVDTE